MRRHCRRASSSPRGSQTKNGLPMSPVVTRHYRVPARWRAVSFMRARFTPAPTSARQARFTALRRSRGFEFLIDPDRPAPPLLAVEVYNERYRCKGVNEGESAHSDDEDDGLNRFGNSVQVNEQHEK